MQRTVSLEQKCLFKLAKQGIFQITLPQFTPTKIQGQLDFVGACHLTREQGLAWCITLHSFSQPAQIWVAKVGTSMIGLAKGGGLKT